MSGGSSLKERELTRFLILQHEKTETVEFISRKHIERKSPRRKGELKTHKEAPTRDRYFISLP
jgi:hypothetical protein